METQEASLAAVRLALARLTETLEEDLEEKTLCQICYDRPKACVLGCGHLYCFACVERVELCPGCRVPITARTRVFA